MISKFFLLVYAVFLFAGAFFGFKAGSKVSLIAGVVSGILVLVGVYFIDANAHNAYLYLTILNGLLTVVFIMRFLKTKKFMPSGMLFFASMIVTIFCLVTLMIS